MISKCRFEFVKAISAACLFSILFLFNLQAQSIYSPVRTFAGHVGNVNDVAFSPDGTQLLTGSSDGSARLWDIATGTRIRVYFQHGGAIRSVAFSPDGTKFVTGSLDKTARLWDKNSGQVLHVFQHAHPVMAVAYSFDGLQIATGSANAADPVGPDAFTWNAASGEMNHVFGASNVASVAFSHDGTKLITGQGFDYNVPSVAHVWSTVSASMLQTVDHSGGVLSAEFSPDDSRFLTSTNWLQPCVFCYNYYYETKIYQGLLHNASTGFAYRAFNSEYTVSDSTFSPDATRVATAGLNSVNIWDNTLTFFKINSIHTSSPSVVYSPDGTLLATGGYGMDHNARIWLAEPTSVDDIQAFLLGQQSFVPLLLDTNLDLNIDIADLLTAALN